MAYLTRATKDPKMLGENQTHPAHSYNITNSKKHQRKTH